MTPSQRRRRRSINIRHPCSNLLESNVLLIAGRHWKALSREHTGLVKCWWSKRYDGFYKSWVPVYGVTCSKSPSILGSTLPPLVVQNSDLSRVRSLLFSKVPHLKFLANRNLMSCRLASYKTPYISLYRVTLECTRCLGKADSMTDNVDQLGSFFPAPQVVFVLAILSSRPDALHQGLIFRLFEGGFQSQFRYCLIVWKQLLSRLE